MQRRKKDWGQKRNCPEESTTLINENYGEESSVDIKRKYPFIRERPNDTGVKMALYEEFDFDPPEIAQLLAFTVYLEKEFIDKLAHEIKIAFCQGDLEEANKSAKELGKILNEDPRLGELLEEDFIRLLVDFLAHEQNPNLQLHAATIIKPVVAYSPNREVVKKYITPSIVVNLVSSKDPELQKEAFWLLRTIALGIPDHPEIKNIIEEAFMPLISFFTDGPSSHESFHIGSLTLAAICQVHPHLPHDKLNSAVSALLRLINYESEEFDIEEVVLHACSGLSYLCDRKKAVVVVERENFEQLIDRLVVLIDSSRRQLINGGIIALGSIVRWSSDDYIELILKKDVLYSLEQILREDYFYFLMDACWILSNITARKESYIEDVIRCECIESLVNVVERYWMPEVRKEAAYAILNAMYNAGGIQINFLRESCGKALWKIFKVFNDESKMVSACLTVFFKIRAVNISYNDKLILDSAFNKFIYNMRVQGETFQLAVDDIDGVPNSKKLRVERFDGSMGFILTCTLEEVPEHNGKLGNASCGTANIAEDLMQVDVPK